MNRLYAVLLSVAVVISATLLCTAVSLGQEPPASEVQTQPPAAPGETGTTPPAVQSQAEDPEDPAEPEARTSQADDRDCSDFESQEEAQDFFEQEGGPDDDSHRLDADSDGTACEDLNAPEGGVDTGFGGMAPTDTASPLLFILGGAGVGLLLGAGMTALRGRRRSSV